MYSAIAKSLINKIFSEGDTACKSLRWLKSKKSLEIIGGSDLIPIYFQF